MSHKRGNLVERRLYEYVLQAVCSGFNVAEHGINRERLANHVAKLFNVDPDEHRSRYERATKTQPCAIILVVDVKRARNLPGEDQNGLSDPYCKVSVFYKAKKSDEWPELNSSSSSVTPPPSPSQKKRTPSLLSCVSGSSEKQRLKPPSRNGSRRSSRSGSSRRLSTDHSSNVSSDKSRASSTVSYRTEVRPKTINPEWNERFEFEIDNINQQNLLITLFDSDRGSVPGMKTAFQEKRGLVRKIQGFGKFLTTGHIEDDFLGQVEIDIQSVAHCDREQWFPLIGPNVKRGHEHESRGEILLGLKVHFKLNEKVNWLTESLNAQRVVRTKDEKNNRHQRGSLSNTIVHFRRRHTTLGSANTANSSIILRSSIFRKNFRPAAMKIRDYTKATLFAEAVDGDQNQTDACLTPTGETDHLEFIEEYHQLCRIIFLHQLEDARDAHPGPTDDIVIHWNGGINDLSISVLTQFRVLYNISVLSESFIQLLVIMELRCSDDYAPFISQGIIEEYLKLFMNKLREKSEKDDLDLSDYEKTVFKEIFNMFIGHYCRRVHSDAPWFPPSKEHLPNILSIFDTIRTLLQLKICALDAPMQAYLEETIRIRLKTDIDDAFSLYGSLFNDSADIQLKLVEDFCEFVKKLADSMTSIGNYDKLFAIFGVAYIKVCFFEENNASDRLTNTTKCLLTTMTDYFKTYAKPMVKASSSIYDANLIRGSRFLLNLYISLQMIVNALKSNLDERDWTTHAFKLTLNDYERWYKPIMKYLIEGFVAGIRQYMERAVEDDNDTIPEEDIVLRSESSVAAIRNCQRICEEWEAMDYPDPDVRYTAMFKLTNTICEQCEKYARRTERKLSENTYFTDLNRTRSFNVSKKLCMLVNDIECVKRSVLSLLPTSLNFQSVIQTMVENYETTDFEQTRITLERRINSAEKEMNNVIQLIFDRVAEFIHVSLLSKISNYYHDEKRNKPDCIKDVIRYIDNQILPELYKGLEPVQYSRVACAVRLRTLQCLRDQLPLKERPEFYTRILRSFDELTKYFDEVCREEALLPGPPCSEIPVFQKHLQTLALTTEELQLTYFKEICQAPSPLEYPANNGEITFRAGYELVSGLVTISVWIIGCKSLPKMDLFGTCDPYVILELLPVSFYHKAQKENRTTTKNKSMNPEFNEVFHWHRLPSTVINERGAVLRLSVWDADMVTDDFIGECFAPLPTIASLKNLASLRDVPVSVERLRKPLKDKQPPVFELLKNRASFDPQAAAFVKSRTDVMPSGNPSDGSSRISDDQHSSDHPHHVRKDSTAAESTTTSYESFPTTCKRAGYQLLSFVKQKQDSHDSTTDFSDDI